MIIKNFDTIVYHDPCSDGTGGLWASCYYKEIKNHCPCKAGSNPTNDFTLMNIIFIDVCPSVEYILKLVKIANYVVILDHHKSAEEKIKNSLIDFSLINNLYIEFDMNRSGCQMAWDYFFDSIPRPFFIDYMADQDLLTWKLENSKEINTALWSLGYINSQDLTKMNNLMENPEEKIKYLVSAGKIINSANQREIQIAISNAIEGKLFCNNKTFRIWLCGNVNPVLRSDLACQLCLIQFNDGSLPDFTVCWQYEQKTKEWNISLRGIAGNSPDLSEIALYYGGGGHPLSSGFNIKYPLQLLSDVFIF